MTRRSLFASVALAALICAGCGSEGPAKDELTVFAAASLKDSFEALAADFEATHPDVKVVLSFAGSQSLRTQIENGAGADIFASANIGHMEALGAEGLISKPLPFAENSLVIAVPADNPANITELSQLVNARRLVLAHANVPAGTYAERMLARAGERFGDDFARRVIEGAVSRELSVRQALQKVVLGEADAAIVYATDAAVAGDKIRTIAIPAELNVTASYPIATLNKSEQSSLAAAFIAHVGSEAGTEILQRFGFRPAAVITAGR